MKTVYVYVNAFESTALCISDATNSELLDAFTWGVKDRIKSKVRPRNPRTLTEVDKIALDIEKSLKPIWHS